MVCSTVRTLQHHQVRALTPPRAAARNCACRAWDDSAQVRAMAAFQVRPGNAPPIGKKNHDSSNQRSFGSRFSSVSMAIGPCDRRTTLVMWRVSGLWCSGFYGLCRAGLDEAQVHSLLPSMVRGRRRAASEVNRESLFSIPVMQP